MKKKLLLTVATAAAVVTAVLGITMITIGATANADHTHPAGAAAAKAIVGTFKVVDRETFKVTFSKPEDVERAKLVLAGEETRTQSAGSSTASRTSTRRGRGISPMPTGRTRPPRFAMACRPTWRRRS